MGRARTIVGAAATLCLGLAATPPARAQAEACDAQFHDGVEARRGGRDAEALEQFTRSWEGCHRPRARVQMAWAYQALGRWVDAATNLGAALEQRDDPWVEARRAQLEDDLRAMQGHVGSVEVAGDAPGAEVLLDGAVVATLPMRAPLPWAAGEVRLEVRLAGRRPWGRTIAVAPGAVTRERVELPAEPPAEPPAARVGSVVPAPRRSALRHGLGVGASVGGGVVLAGAVVAYAYGLSEVGAYNDDPDCPGVEAANQPASCDGRLQTSRAMEVTSAVGFGVGAALAITGVVLLLTERGGRADAAPGSSFACGAGPGAVGCGLRF
jgi:hypothetical protein